MRIWVLFQLCMFLPSITLACSCDITDDPLVELERSDAVFRGVVQSIAVGSPDYWNVVFLVTGSWKGVTTRYISVMDIMDGALCGYGFNTGTEYLVYANQTQSDPPYVANLCTRTNPVISAGEDLAILGPPTIVGTEVVGWGKLRVMYR